MPKYNHSFEEIDGDLVEHWTDKSGHVHTYVSISYEEEDEDGIEDCCRACGNPAYPNCMSSCNLFDD